MKVFEFDLDHELKELVFTPIRNKEDFLRVLLNTIKYIRIYHAVKPEVSEGKVIISKGRMNRISFFSDSKYYSILFPFNIRLNEVTNTYTIHSRHDGEIDSFIIFNILSLLNNETEFYENCISNLADIIIDHNTLNPSFWSLFRALLTCEIGYIRYDIDPENENGALHPLHHLDIHCTSDSTFKLGLHKHIDNINFIDMLDITTDCLYVK